MKIKTNKFDSFLGVSSASGFFGHFDSLETDPDMWLYLIKSGPGCGKSSMMKEIAKIAIEKGESVELIHCSSDPDSLDGAILWDRKIALLDATPPHAVEPSAPGVAQDVVNLYHTIDKRKASANKDNILEQNKTYKGFHKQSASSLAKASSLFKDTFFSASAFYDKDKISKFGNDLAKKLIPEKPNAETGLKHLRFLSAATPKGIIMYDESIQALANIIYAIEDEYGVCSNGIIETICNYALNAGYDVFCCGCPLLPEEKVDFLIIPDLSLAFVTSNSWHKMNFKNQKLLDYNDFIDKAALVNAQSQLDSNMNNAKQMVDHAIKYQQQAMKGHDMLEEYYNPAVDFNKVNEIRESLIEEIFG